MAEIILGQEVKDRVTGFKGIAIGRTTYLQGCNRILVQPKVNKDGELIVGESFDEPDLQVIGVGVLVEPEPELKPRTGGPRPMATRALEPEKKQ